LQRLGSRLDGDRRAPSGDAAVNGLPLVAEDGARCRPQAVGADDEVGGQRLDGTVRAFHHHGGACGFAGERRHGAADEKADAGSATHGIEQDGLQGGPVDDVIRRPEALLHEAAEGHAADHASGGKLADDRPLGFACGAAERRAEAEIDEDAARVGRELNAGAGLAEARPALDYRDVAPAGAQRQRRRETADAGADDSDR
jgi:hypothetical protein